MKKSFKWYDLEIVSSYKGWMKIVAMVFVYFIFITPSTRAADNPNTVYEGTHNFAECLVRVGCSDHAPWGPCGSNKYPFSEKEAYEKAMDIVEFTVLKKTTVRAEVTNIKKCMHGCTVWFDQQVSGKWQYAGNDLWNVSPGNYRLLILSDGGAGCGSPYTQTGFCPSSCIVSLNVYPVNGSIDPKDAIRVDKMVTHDGSHAVSNTVSDHGLRSWVVGNTSHLLNGSNHSAGNAGETKDNNIPVIRPMTRKDKIRLNNQIWHDEQHQIAKEFYDKLDEISLTLGDKALGYIPATATIWGVIKGVNQVAELKWKDASNSFLGVIPYKNLGTAYSLFLDYGSLLSPQRHSPSQLSVPGYEYAPPPYVPNVLVVFPLQK